jgi:delta 1-pyrroline-5-carboxylate dehydrogenase
MGVFDKYTTKNSDGVLELSRSKAFGLISKFIYDFTDLSESILELTLKKFEATDILKNDSLAEDLETIIINSADEMVVVSCIAHFKDEDLYPLFAFLVEGAFSNSVVSKKQARRMNIVQDMFNISDMASEKIIEIAKLKYGYDL